MKIVLLGAPGSGKGTRAKYISKIYNIPNISTGDLFRENMANKTELGLKVMEVMSSGQLCPDELTIEMVKERLSKSDCKNGYLLDGFPRNLYQAKFLDEFSAPDKVVNVVVPFSKIEDRITGRRICEKCNETYNVNFLKGATKCPNCGGNLIQRKDDTPEVVEKRLQVYEEQTKPLINYYSIQNKIINVDGDKDINEIFDDLKKALK